MVYVCRGPRRDDTDVAVLVIAHSNYPLLLLNAERKKKNTKLKEAQTHSFEASFRQKREKMSLGREGPKGEKKRFTGGKSHFGADQNYGECNEAKGRIQNQREKKTCFCISLWQQPFVNATHK